MPEKSAVSVFPIFAVATVEFAVSAVTLILPDIVFSSDTSVTLIVISIVSQCSSADAHLVD